MKSDCRLHVLTRQQILTLLVTRPKPSPEEDIFEHFQEGGDELTEIHRFIVVFTDVQRGHSLCVLVASKSSISMLNTC